MENNTLNDDIEIEYIEAEEVLIDGKLMWLEKTTGELREPITLPIGSLRIQYRDGAGSGRKDAQGA